MTKEWVEHGIFALCNVYPSIQGLVLVLCLYEWIAERMNESIHIAICLLFYFSFEN